MYGGYYGTQQPRIGNKGIVMMNGKFSMYGKPVDQTWTYLASTANIGDTSVTLNTTSHGWKAGD